MNKKIYFGLGIIAAVAVLVILFFLTDETSIPKPRGYFRIDLPEKSYRSYESACPIALEVPEYAKVELFRDRMASDSCWFNIFFPKLNARIHCTYMPVGNRFEQLVNDAYGFAAKHEMKASALKRTLVNDPNRKVFGIIYDIEGDAASRLQFYLTDSTEHFFRGSLYFFNSPNSDSIAPVLSFLREDIIHLTETFQWK